MISRIGDSLQRLSTSYAHDQGQQYPVVLIEIERDGRLLRCEIIDSSGSPRLDNDALDAVERTEFEPLPEWYTGFSIPFKIDFSRVRQ